MAPETKADASIGAQDLAMPESKADLLASTNEAAGVVQKFFFTYLLVSLYLAILIGSTTHEQMLRESGVQLPLFGVGLSVFWVYAVAPWLFLALHVNLLVQHYLLSRKLHAFNRALKVPNKDGKLPEEREWRVRLYPSMFAQMLAGAESRYLKRFVLQSIVFTTVAVAPVVLLLWMQIRFLPYHSELVTWGNRLALIADLVMLWYYWPFMMVDEDEDVSWRQIVTHERPLLRSSVCAVLSFGVLLVSTVVAVVPGGLAERMTFTETDERRWGVVAAATCDTTAEAPSINASVREKIVAAVYEEIPAVVPECLRGPRGGVRACLPRYLDVREATLLAEEPAPEIVAALMNGDDGAQDQGAAETMRERTVGLPLEGRDLRGADFRHADLTKADLERAKLNGANLGCTKLIGAILSGAELRDADLTDATLHSAELKGAVLPSGGGLSVTKGLRTTNLGKVRLIGANLESMEMDGADLSGAQLQGAWLQGAKLRGANLKNADLRGANLQGAQLQGAELKNAKLQGADLREASVGGAKFTGAQLDYADLRGIKDTDKESKDTDENPKAIEILRVFATHGDVLAKVAVDRLTSADGKPIDLSGANGESVLCGKLSPDQLIPDEVSCLKAENKPIREYPTTIEEYRKMVEDYCKTIERYRWCLVNYVLAPLVCDEDAGLSDAAEASALLDVLRVRVGKNPTIEASPTGKDEEPTAKDKLKARKESDGATNTQSDDQTRSTTSLLAKALRGDTNCYAREVLSGTEFDDILDSIDRTQTTK